MTSAREALTSPAWIKAMYVDGVLRLTLPKPEQRLRYRSAYRNRHPGIRRYGSHLQRIPPPERR